MRVEVRRVIRALTEFSQIQLDALDSSVASSFTDNARVGLLADLFCVDLRLQVQVHEVPGVQTYPRTSFYARAPIDYMWLDA